jgi:hypothetical protein
MGKQLKPWNPMAVGGFLPESYRNYRVFPK